MTAQTPRPFYTASGRVIDLHNKAVDVTGRVDILVARAVRLAVEKNTDPILRMWYAQFQPFIDAEIHGMLAKHNMKRTLINLGIAPPPQRAAAAKKRVSNLKKGKTQQSRRKLAEGGAE
jgi:hypothetical protein